MGGGTVNHLPSSSEAVVTRDAGGRELLLGRQGALAHHHQIGLEARFLRDLVLEGLFPSLDEFGLIGLLDAAAASASAPARASSPAWMASRENSPTRPCSAYFFDAWAASAEASALCALE